MEFEEGLFLSFFKTQHSNSLKALVYIAKKHPERCFVYCGWRELAHHGLILFIYERRNIPIHSNTTQICSCLIGIKI